MKVLLSATLTLVMSTICTGQNYWQQAVDYKMEIDFDVDSNKFTGVQTLTYTNNSPDTLSRVFYHLYFNAFQPGSMMDIRSRTIEDPDPRIGNRIFNLLDHEIGYHKIQSLRQNGNLLKFQVVGTVVEVRLTEPILPNSESVFEMKFESQVPVQIRRSGHDNKEGIEFSMSQWFPKIAEYDRHGWHPDPYIGREFFSSWGNYEVVIKIDEKYVIGATGILQNPEEIGHGYDTPNSPGKKAKDGKLIWRFKAENVHDFVWAADPDYLHDVVEVDNQPLMHYFYQNDTSIIQNWKELQVTMSKAIPFMNEHFGKYEYPQYSIIQGGDGGMEYPMATLIVGNISLKALVSVSVHEMLHSWYYGFLANNESKYPWMDEGFTAYAQALTKDFIYHNSESIYPLAHRYETYFELIDEGLEEPMSIHADHFNTNSTQVATSYSKGAIMLNQLEYIIGKRAFANGLLKYFDEWKFKHPSPDDFFRVMERESGIVLDWYQDYWVNTTRKIDYGIRSVVEKEDKTEFVIERIGKMPMPLDVEIELQNGERKKYNIPLNMMRGAKALDVNQVLMSNWPWVNPYYTLVVPYTQDEIKKVEIDPTRRMADVDRSNNVHPFTSDVNFIGEIRK